MEEPVDTCDANKSVADMEDHQYERKSSLTLIVGDEGTNKVLRRVKGRSEAA